MPKKEGERKVPKLRFKGFTDDWKQCNGEDIFKKRNERKNENEYYELDLGLENLVSNSGILTGTTHQRTNSKTIFYEGDTLFGRLRPYLNKWWYATKNGIKSGEIWALYPTDNNSSRFIYNLVQTNQFLYYANISSGSRMPRASWDNIAKQNFYIPNLNEQKLISNLLHKIERIITLEQEKNNLYTQLKEDFLQKLFAQKDERLPQIRFEGFDDSWKQYPLEEMVIVNSGRDYKHLNEGDIPVYGTGGRMTNVDESLSDMDAVGIGRKGTINKPQMLTAPFWTVDTLFYITPKTSLDLTFFYYLTQTINWLRYDESTGVPSLSKKTINNIKVRIPIKEEQFYIGKILKTIDHKITLNQNKLLKYKMLKKILLQNLFT